MANKKKKENEIGLQNRLEIVIKSLQQYKSEGGIARTTPLGYNEETGAPPTLVIHLPGVIYEPIPDSDGKGKFLVEYATNTATNGDG